MTRSLNDFIAVHDATIPARLCAEIIRGFETNVALQQRNGAGAREGLADSAWTEMNVSKLADVAFQAFFEGLVLDYFGRYNASLALPRPLSSLEKLNDLMLKCYRAGTNERFQIHFDSIRQHSNRYLVFLWYLNDVEVGGETWFPDLNLKVAPRAGRLLIFPPYWMFQHAGLAPVSEDKYILSTYAVY